MAEILIKAVSAAHVDQEKDLRGCYKRGMPVVVRPDGHPWGAMERLPNFVVIKVPLIDVSRVEKFIQPELSSSTSNGDVAVTRRRIYRILWANLPQSARDKLQATGELVIKASVDYTGAYDYTWTQVQSYFLNQKTGLTEIEDL